MSQANCNHTTSQALTEGFEGAAPTRRGVLRAVLTAGIGAVAMAGMSTASGATVPLDADMTGPLTPIDDVELFTRLAEFNRLDAVHSALTQQFRAQCAAADEIAPPPWKDPARSPGLGAYERAREETGASATYTIWCDAGRAAAIAARALFATPARTIEGVTAKLLLWHRAYGDGAVDDDAGGYLNAYDNDSDYERGPLGEDDEGCVIYAEVPDYVPWFDRIVADLRTMAGEVQA